MAGATYSREIKLGHFLLFGTIAETTHAVPNLNTENYHVWCYCLRIHLKLEKALKALDKEKPIVGQQ